MLEHLNLNLAHVYLTHVNQDHAFVNKKTGELSKLVIGLDRFIGALFLDTELTGPTQNDIVIEAKQQTAVRFTAEQMIRETESLELNAGGIKDAIREMGQSRVLQVRGDYEGILNEAAKYALEKGKYVKEWNAM